MCVMISQCYSINEKYKLDGGISDFWYKDNNKKKIIIPLVKTLFLICRTHSRK